MSIKATLTANGRTLAELNLPRSLADVRLSQFVNFLVECRNLEDTETGQLQTMCRAISAFCDVPLETIIQAEAGNVQNITGLESSVSGVFGYLANLIGGAQGEPLTADKAEFQYKGETYRIPYIVQLALAGEVNLPGLSVIETIEALEVQRWKLQATKNQGDPDGAIKRRIMGEATAEVSLLPQTDRNRAKILEAAEKTAAIEIEKAGDPNGSLLFSMYLRMLAVLCRKPGEHMPFEDSARETWIQERALHFADIDAQTALNVDFFLSNIFKPYENGPLAPGSLIRQSFAVLVAIRLRKPKRKTAQGSTMRKYSSA